MCQQLTHAQGLSSIIHDCMQLVIDCCCVLCCLFICDLLSDLTVGDLSGHMTTVRASPLVSVVMKIDDPPTTIDLMDDRKCRINDDITLLWYDITHDRSVITL